MKKEKRPHPLEQLKDRDKLTEGKADILYHKGAVFYNPVQEFNRDLSVAVLSAYGSERNQRLRVVECLSATGLRSIRYALEVPHVETVVANDIDAGAVRLITANVSLNNVEAIVQPIKGDANATLLKIKQDGERIDVIDLDPYGSASPFLDSALQSISSDGTFLQLFALGLLCVTCTDLQVLCASYNETCYAKYGSMPIRGDACHEMALRIVLSLIDRTAAKYKKYITPLLSFTVDFYLRVFVKISQNAEKVKLCGTCVQCRSFWHIPLLTRIVNGKSVKMAISEVPHNDVCLCCGGRLMLAGPIWNGPLHSTDFVQRVIKICAERPFGTQKRLVGILSVINEEIEVPLYMSLPEMAGTIYAITPRMADVKSALLNAGFRVSISHSFAQAIKTDAPMEKIWSVIVQWSRRNENNSTKRKDDKHAAMIYSKYESSNDISFEFNNAAVPKSMRDNLCRFQENPTRHWGPLGRAKPSSE